MFVGFRCLENVLLQQIVQCSVSFDDWFWIYLLTLTHDYLYLKNIEAASLEGSLKELTHCLVSIWG